MKLTVKLPAGPNLLKAIRIACILAWAAVLVFGAVNLALDAGHPTKWDWPFVLIVIVAGRELWDWGHM